MSDLGDTSGGAGLVGQDEAVVGGYVPRILFSTAGAPIAQVYAGGGLASRTHNPSRTIHFRGGIYGGKPARPVPIAYGSSYVPQHSGYTGIVRVQKRMEGQGEFVEDPMSNFKPQKFKESKSASQDVSQEEKNAAKKEYKNMGRRAYKSANKANRETPSRKLVK